MRVEQEKIRLEGIWQIPHENNSNKFSAVAKERVSIKKQTRGS
jgi:hypothetical protein